MDNRPSALVKVHGLLIKICAVFLLIFLVVYSIFYALKMDMIYWALISACVLAVLAALLLSKLLFNANAKKTFLSFLLRGLFLTASIVLLIITIKIQGKYTVCYSPNRTNAVVIERTQWKEMPFISVYKMKYGIFKINGERLLFANNVEPEDKASVIVWSNEDAASVEGKYLDFTSDGNGNVGPTNPDLKYFLNFY